MLSLKEQTEALCAIGYTKETAQAKVVHDAVLLAMSRCGFKMNSTVKGGVVMSSLTGNVRRATMDMDIDFIHYSIGDVSVRRFVSRLTKSIPEMELKMIGTPIELKHEDYRGKRIYLAVRDASIRRWMRTKVDIGVHKRESIEQIDFSFTTASSPSAVKLQANSPEQIFAEKLLSLLRHGVNSNRPKDLFDMYYLSQSVKRKKLKTYVAELIYANKRCKISTHGELMRMIRLVFGMNVFVRKLDNTRVNWLDVSPREMLDLLATFLNGLK